MIIFAWEVITYHTYLHLLDSCVLMKSVSSLSLPLTPCHALTDLLIV